MRLAGALALLVAIAPALAEHPSRLSPDEPADGAITGRRPRFVVRAEGAAAESARFRIELSRDGFRTVAYTFDQLADPNGWVYAVLDTGTPAAVYAPRQPLDAGRYAWRVSSWDGVTWKTAPASFRLDVDDVPPAPVRGLAVRRDADAAGCVRLSWDPVTVDTRGESERIARYHVLRLTKAAAPAGLAATRIGDAIAPAFADCDPASAAGLLYYLVVAEDEAGNVGPPSSLSR